MVCLYMKFRFSLSYRDMEELCQLRGLAIDHATLQRWVIRFASLLDGKFQSRKKAINGSWRMDETYIKVKGEWCYLYRAVDKYSQTIDIYLSKRRDTTSAKRFFQKCFRSSGVLEKVNIDKSSSNTAALKAINKGES